MKKIIYSLSAIILIFYFSSCKSKAGIDINNYMKAPDKIIIYKSGKQNEITKIDKLYSEIFSENFDRVSKIDVIELGVDEEYVNNLKVNETVIEYVFADSMQTVLQNPLNKSIKYNRILFPITGKHNNTMFYGDNNKYLYWFTILNGDRLLDVIEK
jgi:hypothetical protein